MTTAAEDIEGLVAAAAGGDRGAQQELLERYWPVIHQAIRGRKSRLGSSLAAREQTVDLEQQAAIRVLERLPQQRWQGKSAFAAWIKRLSEGEVVDAYRHHRAQKRDAAADTDAAERPLAALRLRSPESRMDDHERLVALSKSLAQLKDEHAAALLMHHMGFTHREIGETLDCSEEAARKLVTRARKNLLKLRDG